MGSLQEGSPSGREQGKGGELAEKGVPKWERAGVRERAGCENDLKVIHVEALK